MKKIILISLFLVSLLSFKTFASEEQSQTICSANECYTIIRKLGAGAFGEVHAVESSQGLPFAIKSYKIAWDPSEIFLDAQREFSRGQLLDHSNIIKSHELFMSCADDGVAHIVLDLVNGKPLYEVEKGEIDSSHLLDAILQFLDALRYAYAMELMHLDLHEGNIMLDYDSNIMVIDLASFFTLDEIHSFFIHRMSEQDGNQYPTAYSQQTIDETWNVLNEPSKMPLVPLRAAKLEKFFNENPEISSQIKKAFVENEALSSIKAKKITEFSKNAAILATVKSPKTLSVTNYLAPYQINYFDRITDICVRLISKSVGNRNEKIEMRANIKKIAWQYEEDRAEGISLPFAIYFDQLFDAVR